MQDHTHEWKVGGFWDGVSKTGEKIGGRFFVCRICKAEVQSTEDALNKGGTIVKESPPTIF